MAPKTKKGQEDNHQQFWFPEPNEGYALGDILLEDTQNNLQVKLHLKDGSTKVSCSTKWRIHPSVPPERGVSVCSDDHCAYLCGQAGEPTSTRWSG